MTCLKVEQYVTLCLLMHDPTTSPSPGSEQEDDVIREQDRLWISMTPAERLEAEARSLVAVIEQERLLDELRKDR